MSLTVEQPIVIPSMEVCESTAGPAAGIQAIDKGAVHRICSGQVVLNLATAIKELVENSIDAGATNIEVRLKDHGSELVEVVDNGYGVEPENFAGLTLKHHTSKLKDFSDLVNVDTFGFRGEALSSLCALSKLTVITCHKAARVGTRLEYDHNGKLSKQSPCPRQTGTTVSVENVFSTLPVRHKEFHRNLKKEFTKAIQVLNAYCMISTGVRITCTNQVGKGKKNIVVSTGGNPSIRENITNIFGAKQGQGLLELAQASPTEEVFTEFGIKDNEKGKNLFEISGYLSSSEHGQGRSSSDRQYYFINNRPCDPQKISRLVNEVYHSYNRHQNPFVMMNITLAKDSVDVNVTPDKRQIFIHQERLLLAIIKSSLVKLFEPKSSLYRIAQPGTGSKNSPLCKTFSIKSPIESPVASNKKSLTSTLANLKRSFSSAFAKDGSEPGDTDPGNTGENQMKQRKLDNFVTRPATETTNDKTSDISFTTESLSVSLSENDSLTNPDCRTGSGNTSFRGSQTSEVDSQTSGVSSADTEMLDQRCVPVSCRADTAGEKSESAVSSAELKTAEELSENSELNLLDANDSEQSRVSLDDIANGSVTNAEDVSNLENLPYAGAKSLDDSPAKLKVVQATDGKISLNHFRHRNHSAVSSPLKMEILTNSQASNQNVESVGSMDNNDTGQSPIKKKPKENPVDSPVENSQEPKITFTEYDAAGTSLRRREVNVPFSMGQLKDQMKNKSKAAAEGNRLTCRSFRATISPTDNQAAETELQKEISKDMFKNMEILGQFNLGFIIVKLGRDLFIVDQHATDEKYNFETLQRETVIQGQKLIQPQNLELTSANECVLLDNLDIFRKNGFEFLIDEDGLPTERVKLVTMPVSRNWVFGKDDIEELIFMLSDCPGVMCRPSRIRAMFASRACRKSIMIGTALNEAQMKKLVYHMGEIDQPWNCPHGRPTMRHLINLDMLPY